MNRSNAPFFFSLAFIFTLICVNQANATPPSKTIALQTCKDEKLGIQFLCDPDWELQTENDVLLILISPDPSVTLSISRSESPVVSLDNLNNANLQEMGQYKDGFKTQMIKIDQVMAIEVEGENAQKTEVNLDDFYIVHDGFLYAFQFSVSPGEKTEEYLSLMRAIVNSIHFNKIKPD